MHGRQVRSRRELRLWRDDLLKLRATPFDVGEHSLVVAYAVAAEASCFLALGWRMPTHVIDLYAEHLLAINGLGLSGEAYTLIGAMARHRLSVMTAAHKEGMRNKIIGQDHWSADEAREILWSLRRRRECRRASAAGDGRQGSDRLGAGPMAWRLHGRDGSYLAQWHPDRRGTALAALRELAAPEANADRAG